MSCAPVPSDLIHVICQRLSEFEHTGLQLDPNHVSKLMTNLRTVRELAREVEDENRILERRLQEIGRTGAGRVQDPVTIDLTASNVVRFPPRVRVVAPRDGGDAA